MSEIEITNQNISISVDSNAVGPVDIEVSNLNVTCEFLGVGIQGPQGPKGDTVGIPGPQGNPGVDGVDGVDGADGVDGVDGLPGTNGIDGIDGAPGADGVDGLPGTNGTDGVDGVDGVDGATEVFVSDIEPAITKDSLWVQTGLGRGGNNFTLYFMQV